MNMTTKIKVESELPEQQNAIFAVDYYRYNGTYRSSSSLSQQR